MGKTGRVRDPRRALFSTFFRTRFEPRTWSPGWPPREGGRGGRGEGRTRDRGSTRRNSSIPAIGHRVHSPDLRDLGGLRELCSHDLAIVWHKDTMELARTSPSQSPRPLDPADRVRRSLRTPFELRACSKPDRLGLRPRSSELRSLPLELRSSSMMCARRSPAEQDPAAYRKKIPGLASTIHLDGKFPCI